MLTTDDLLLLRLHVERGCSCTQNAIGELLDHIDALQADLSALRAAASRMAGELEYVLEAESDATRFHDALAAYRALGARSEGEGDSD